MAGDLVNTETSPRVAPTNTMPSRGARTVGVTVEKIKRDEPMASRAGAKKGCAHHRVHWRGSNGFVRIKTCPAWTVASKSGSTLRWSISKQSGPTSFTKDEALNVIDTFSRAMATKITSLEDKVRVPGDSLEAALQLTMRQASLWHQLPGYEGAMDLGRPRTERES